MATGYLLDTNVISETRKRGADANVMAFLSAVGASELFLSVLTFGELRKGVKAKRRSDPLAADALSLWVDGLETTYLDRVIAVDTAIARRWGELSASASVPVVDTLIAATAIERGFTVVTRNARDFAVSGVAVINPWIAR